MNPDRAMNEIEAANRLGLSVATLRAWRHRSKGPRFVRFGRAVRYLPGDLADFIRASAVDAEPISRLTGTDAHETAPI